ncbi:MAG: hypothetical protein ISR82_01200 [Candidatus Marinimicrobia bacterium]|nr:hypothetical protein [Candidatus Neomarinimicrobiota bacterium]MBL7009823.1 hypothetical protein [Candidatus Neomarinimicrobiota bacterium]MBL7029938.1 hypothetical protein [Candidatus Neomarinimicrobiota bacterium]
MKHQYISIVFFIIIFTTSGCENNNEKPNNTLVPLSVGNYWAYEQKVYSGEDHVIEGLTDSLYGEIVGDTTVILDGQSYHSAIWGWFNPPTYNPRPYKWLYTNGDSGLYILGAVSPKDTLFKKHLYLKYPAQKEDKWEHANLVYDHYTQTFLFADTLTYTCIATNQDFETPIGTFSCYVYHYQRKLAEDISGISDFYLYYAPGIGRVGAELKDRGILKYRQVLFNYHLN